MTTTTFPAADGTPLSERRWPARGGGASPRGSVVLVHGYGEHIGRYEHVASAFARAGFTVVGADLRGHGLSGGVRGFCTRFDEYLSDLSTLLARAREAAPGPQLLVAHSFGALISTKYILDRPDAVAGLVVSSPFYRLALDVPRAKLLAGRIASAVYPKLALPSGLKGVDVTRDPELQRIYDADPLNLKNATARWFTETERVQGEVLARAAEVRLPVLAVIGAADRVAKAAHGESVVRKFSSVDKTIHMLEGQFHEVFNEPKPTRDQTIALVRDWLVAHSENGARSAQQR
jgi:alpha-beta hydrolase superfamily lysophospholipase